MFKKFFKYFMLVSATIFCFSCGTKSEEQLEIPKSKENAITIIKAPAEKSLLADPKLAGEEHNRALSFLVKKFDSKERPTYDEIFEVWIDYAQQRMVEYGYPKISDEDVKIYYESFKALNRYCKTQFVGDAIISYIKYMDEAKLISHDFTEYCLYSFNNIDFEENNPLQIKESMMKKMPLLNKEEMILAQNMIGIAEYSTAFWKEYFAAKAPKNDDENNKDDESKEEKEDKDDKELKRRNDNLRDLAAVCVDAVAGAGISTTGVGTVLSGVAGTVGSFLFKEAMGW